MLRADGSRNSKAPHSAKTNATTGCLFAWLCDYPLHVSLCSCQIFYFAYKNYADFCVKVVVVVIEAVVVVVLFITSSLLRSLVVVLMQVS